MLPCSRCWRGASLRETQYGRANHRSPQPSGVIREQWPGRVAMLIAGANRMQHLGRVAIGVALLVVGVVLGLYGSLLLSYQGRVAAARRTSC